MAMKLPVERRKARADAHDCIMVMILTASVALISDRWSARRRAVLRAPAPVE